nr:hypothetical protein CFP56_21553 [Quercus suber]
MLAMIYDNFHSHMPSDMHRQHQPPHLCCALHHDGGLNTCGTTSIEQKHWQLHISKSMQDPTRVKGSKPKYYFSRPHKGKNPGALGRLKDVFTGSGADVFVNVRGKERGAQNATASDFGCEEGCACCAAKLSGCAGEKGQTSLNARACVGTYGTKIQHRVSEHGAYGMPSKSASRKASWTCKDTNDRPWVARSDTEQLKTRFESGSVPWWHDCSFGGHPAAVA